jgi:hypothetical protein
VLLSALPTSTLLLVTGGVLVLTGSRGLALRGPSRSSPAPSRSPR